MPLMIQGKIRAAIRLIIENNRGHILSPDDVVFPETPNSPTVLEALKSKHKPPQPCVEDAVAFSGSDPPAVHPIIYEGLDAHRIWLAGPHTTGAGGPLGTDTIVGGGCSQHLKGLLINLCHFLSLLTRKLCSVYIDQGVLTPFGLPLGGTGEESGDATLRHMRNGQMHHSKGVTRI